MSNKNFNISRAFELKEIYKKSHHYAKERFIEELVSYQYFFGSDSIVGCKLFTNHNYQKRTVESVLNDLGYELVTFSHTRQRGLYGQTFGLDTNFSFTEKDSNK